MYCLFDMIYTCSVQELENLNLSNFEYIINCSVNLNNVLMYSNIINANLNRPLNFMISDIIQLIDNIYNCHISGIKIILLDETGIDNSMFITIMFLMKYHNKNFESIYSLISFNKLIHPKEYYNSINLIEYYLLNNFSNTSNQQNKQNKQNPQNPQNPQNKFFNLQYKNNI